MLIKLTDKNGSDVLVNLDKIQTVRQGGMGGTLISFSSKHGDFIEVKETVEKVIDMDQF